MKSQAPRPNALAEWFQDADQYLFGFGSATALGLFRMLFGFFAFVNYLMIWPYWRDWFGESGYVPAWLGRVWFRDHSELPSGLAATFPNGFPRLDLIVGVTDPRITVPFYLMVIVAAAFTCIGFGTRIASFLLMVGVVSLHHRNGAILHGGDTLMRIGVIYIAVSPTGQACSVDRLIGLWRGTATWEPPRVSLWSQRLIAFNIALLYFTSVWFKWDGDKWRTLSATYYPERLAEFYRFPVPEVLRTMWFARVTTLGTLLTEFSMGTLVFFPPARKYVLLAGVLMHVWIEYSMNIPLFSFLMISSYVVFFEGEEIAAWALGCGKRLRRFHAEVRLPLGMKLSPRGIAFFGALDPLGFITFLPGDAGSTSACCVGGGSLSVDRALFTRCVGGWPFLWIPKLPSKLIAQCLEPVPSQPSSPQDEESGRLNRPRRLKRETAGGMPS